MRKAVTLFFILTFLLATAELASAHNQRWRYRGQRYEWRTHRRPHRVRVLGVRYYRPVYYAQRRRVYLVHRRNAERHYWHRRAQQRRWWLRHHRRMIR